VVVENARTEYAFVIKAILVQSANFNTALMIVISTVYVKQENASVIEDIPVMLARN
jgi:hypothetical protein